MTKSKLTLIVVSLIVLMQSCGQKQNQVITERDFGIVPLPVSTTEKEGVFIFNAETKIFAEKGNAEALKVAGFFAEMLNVPSGFALEAAELEGEAGKNSVLFAGSDKKIPAEGYELNISPDAIVVTASDGRGFFYGMQSIRQLLPAEIESKQPAEATWFVPAVEIKDNPRFVWRGLMLDVSRHFFPKQFIKKYIDYLAMNKMNIFHWHLVDDQGWRIEIKKYPKLTEVGAFRVDHEDKHWSSRPRQQEGEKATYGGFYTQSEIKEIVQYAADRYITIVPEIEMPAHITCALAAYPHLSCTGGEFTVPSGGVWPITDIYCAGNDSVFLFLQDVLTEVIDLFPGKYIHIGGDEATKKEWEVCSKCQARIKEEGLANEHELQSYFIKRIEKFLNKKGRTLIGWDEILEGGLAPEATVMSWRGMKGGIAAARQNHDVVMSPGTHCYFDHYQGKPEMEPLAIGGYTTLKKVYAFDPVPADSLTEDQQKHILGGQANLWTEYIPTPEHAEYMIFPRSFALAEAVWSPLESRNWQDFMQRMTKQYKRMDIAGINYSRSVFNVDIITTLDENNVGKLIVKLETQGLQDAIRYTVDGTEPSITSAEYTAPFVVDKTTTIKVAAFSAKAMLGKVSELTIPIHKATAKKVTLNSTYSDRYTSGGDNGVINSMKGSKNFNDGNWQGYNGNDFDAVIDLGEVTEVSKIALGTALNAKSWIFPPQYVEFSISENGTDFKPIAKIENEINLQKRDIVLKEMTAEFEPLKARYIKVFAKNIEKCPEWHSGAGKPAWMFVDEVIVE